MKRCASWLFVGFVLAILLTLDLRPDRPTRGFFDSPIAPAPCLYLSRLFDPAFTVPAVKPTQFSLHLEARRSRAGPDECLPLLSKLSNFSLDHAQLRADNTGPPLDLRGPPGLVRTAPRLKLQGMLGTSAAFQKGDKLPSEPAKTGAPARIGVLQRVIFTTGFS